MFEESRSPKGKGMFRLEAGFNDVILLGLDWNCLFYFFALNFRKGCFLERLVFFCKIGLLGWTGLIADKSLRLLSSRILEF